MSMRLKRLDDHSMSMYAKGVEGPRLGAMVMRPHFELNEEDERQNKQQTPCIEDAKDN